MAGRKPQKYDRDKLFDYALRSLGARAHSISELRTKLRSKAANLEDVDEVMSRCKQYGYLNDRKYADTVAASRKDGSGFGKARVLRELAAKRVPATVAQQAVEAAYEGQDETTLIENFLARKFRNTNLHEYLSDQKHLMSAFRKLRVAGFSSGAAIKVLKRHAAEADHLEEADIEEPNEGIEGGLEEV